MTLTLFQKKSKPILLLLLLTISAFPTKTLAQKQTETKHLNLMDLSFINISDYFIYIIPIIIMVVYMMYSLFKISNRYKIISIFPYIVGLTLLRYPYISLINLIIYRFLHNFQTKRGLLQNTDIVKEIMTGPLKMEQSDGNEIIQKSKSEHTDHNKKFHDQKIEQYQNDLEFSKDITANRTEIPISTIPYVKRSLKISKKLPSSNTNLRKLFLLIKKLINNQISTDQAKFRWNLCSKIKTAS